MTLGSDIPGLTLGEVHREVEDVLAGVDRALSTWRSDSDASRFNRARAGEWVAVAPDLVAVVAIARRVHDDTGGAFDITAVARAVAGMHLVEIREQPPALRKARDGVALDLGGIGPGYTVDAIGTRLAALGSASHLVELGGEVRAWGTPPSGGRWRVAPATCGNSLRARPWPRAPPARAALRSIRGRAASSRPARRPPRFGPPHAPRPTPAPSPRSCAGNSRPPESKTELDMPATGY